MRRILVLGLVLFCTACASTKDAAPPLGPGVDPELARPVALVPAARRVDARDETACTMSGFDVGVSPDGGVTLTYLAVPGSEAALQSEVRRRVRRHNRRAGALTTAGSPEHGIASVALCSNEPNGAKVTLLPVDTDQAAALFANAELYAPDLFPSRKQLSCAEKLPVWSIGILPEADAFAALIRRVDPVAPPRGADPR